MSRLARNESIKLVANWANSLSVTVISVGAIGPFVAEFLGLGAPPAGSDVTTGFAIICICGGGILHSVGQIVLGGLSDE